ncbi:NmrA-like family protein [Colletotrichum nymphaeae SA-01]|uniref:NmrA-like family domain-containing protein 1 n=1 Tax=Colletotrichum nymphaeae SA-01 TaxID=1460502 RepID=A0A135RPK2_9PEZI|nr:NmrA-like family protein [Colletotrichum nymphaeae SA-01]
MAKRVITVFGSTGNQGGAIVRTFLSDPKLKNEWAVRGVTRDVSKDSAKALASLGVEVVAADIRDKNSVLDAIKGSHTVFAVTNYWEKLDFDDEVQQGKNLAEAAKEAGVHHFIWSSLINVTKLSNGSLPHVYHFDSKAKVEEYVRELAIPATFFMPGFYMPNLPAQMLSQNPPQNYWSLALPIPSDAPIPLYDPGDTGKYIKAAVLNREKLLGQHILAATEYKTGQEILNDFKEVFPEAGKSATYIELSEKTFKETMTGSGSPEFVATEMYENMRLMADFGYYGGDSLTPTHSVVEDDLTTWKEFAKSSKPFAMLH